MLIYISISRIGKYPAFTPAHSVPAFCAPAFKGYWLAACTFLDEFK
jgi:hypothetical protein